MVLASKGHIRATDLPVLFPIPARYWHTGIGTDAVLARGYRYRPGTGTRGPVRVRYWHAGTGTGQILACGYRYRPGTGTRVTVQAGYWHTDTGPVRARLLQTSNEQITNRNNNSIYTAQNLVWREYSKRIRARAHTHHTTHTYTHLPTQPTRRHPHTGVY